MSKQKLSTLILFIFMVLNNQQQDQIYKIKRYNKTVIIKIILKDFVSKISCNHEEKNLRVNQKIKKLLFKCKYYNDQKPEFKCRIKDRNYKYSIFLKQIICDFY